MTSTSSASDVRRLLTDAFRILSRRRRLILGVFLVVALAISAAVLSVPTSYEVTGKLVVTRERGDLLITPADQRLFNYVLTAPTIQDMAVHADLLKNRSLVGAVVAQLELDRGASGLDGRVDTILSGLTVQVVPNSNLINVRYRSTDPVRGADIVNALLDQYRALNLRLRASPGATEFFEAQHEQVAASLEASERTLTAFRTAATLAAASSQVDAYSRQLAEAESDAVDAQYDRREAEARAAIIKEQLDREPERIAFSSTTQHNPMIRMVQERLLALEMEERQLLTLYADTDRRVQDKRREIEAQQRQLAEARVRERVPGSVVTELNGRRRDLEVQHIAATLAVRKNAIRAEGARTIAAEMHERVRALAVADVRREALAREIQASSDAYLLYGKKAQEARLTAGLDDNLITNVVIGEPASREGVPVGPPKSLSLVFAVAVGLVSGAGGAFLRDLFDRPLDSRNHSPGPRG